MVDYKGYLIDLDGTIYRGNTAIQGAEDFIRYLREKELPHLFVTNNASMTQADVAGKLNKMGIEAENEQIMTSAVACATYISDRHAQARVYMIGEKGLHEALVNAGCHMTAENADYVVVGIDRDLSYEKLKTASLLIQQGATFISTNKDPAIPTEEGLLPGNGAITAAVERASGKAPIYIGKPEPIIMYASLNLLGLTPKDILMVGDNYLTDIQAGINTGIDTLMVLTGYSSPHDIPSHMDKPTHIANDLVEWLRQQKALV